MARSLRQSLIKCLIGSHRYLGIAIGALVVMWFATGIAMIYTGGMPFITPQQRLDRLSAVDLSRIRFSPSQAAERANLGQAWSGVDDGRITLLTVMDRPAYRFGEEATVFADTGEEMQPLSVDQCQLVATRFLAQPEKQLHFAGTLTRVDQWTIGRQEQMPLHKFAADDGTEIYVQPGSGEVATMTTRHTRTLAWISAIPHWLYFARLRANEPVWFQVVIWTSSLACLLAVLGFILAFAQFKRTRPFSLAAAIPYSGWLRWHYITGAVFGIFTLTWLFSGLLSMEPFAWTRAESLQLPGDTFSLAPLDLAQFANVGDLHVPCREALKEVELVRLFRDPYYLVRCGATERHLISASDFREREKPFDPDLLVARIADVSPGVFITDQEMLTQYDSYYYSRDRSARLPVLRVKLDDPARSWLYVDPLLGRLVAEIPRYGRAQRWLYTGLHDLDFPFWYDRRPLWDIGVIALCLGGLASSGIGLYLGVRRLLRLGRKASPL